MRTSLLALAVFALAACDSTEVEPIVRAPAQYTVTLQATWSAATHPDAFPPNPHFSRLTGAVHADDVTLWRVGGRANDGVRSMAETGNTSAMRTVVESQGSSAAYVEGDPIHASPGSGSATFTVSEQHPLATVVTMLAPSPDWYVGTSGLDLRTETGWADRVEVDAVVYDAGTDDGSTYTAANATRDERAPIVLVDYAPLAGTPVGTLVFERVL
ncbi:spondin domain-containing protein [Rubrivirga sp.]|uniref:spondin domain-containing protein n=1 Tax=Rubrivirga sp. TaxID=1885344 RepID=UPI003C771FBC